MAKFAKFINYNWALPVQRAKACNKKTDKVMNLTKQADKCLLETNYLRIISLEENKNFSYTVKYVIV